jgi:hypothetical protein
MAQPRFQLRVVRRRPKPETTDRRLVADARASGLDDRIVWRLLGANNRELGRSGAQFGSVDECLGGIARLRAVLHGGQPVAPSLASTDHGAVWRRARRSPSCDVTVRRRCRPGDRVECRASGVQGVR